MQADKKIVHLIRHGVTDWNTTNRCMGQQDIPLNAEGWRQAGAVAEYFAERPVDRVIASDLQRTRETATPLCERKGIPLESDTRLREICYGALEGWTPDEWPERFGSYANMVLRLFRASASRRRESAGPHKPLCSCPGSAVRMRRRS